tara:strand:- start:125 stop:1111 length:987 start_codon:yes stop_codon:yes gene_type:complete
MDHLQRSRLNLLTSHMLDRGALLRLDSTVIAELARSERARFIGIHHLRIAVDEAHPQRPAWLPRQDVKDRFGQCDPYVYLGEEDNLSYFALLLDHDLPKITEGFASLRTLAREVSSAQATLLSYAQAMATWHHRYRFCNRCGSATHIGQAGHVRLCTQVRCGETHYPRTDPAIIVLVQREDRALFGRKPEWPANRYSTIAGFVEPGESAEQAVVREVAEETGIDVTAARYHSSQPWPFPGSLMLGYHAEAGNDRISLNDHELEDALWLSRKEIADRMEQGLFVPPPSISISFRLIEDWFDQKAFCSSEESRFPFTLRAVCQKSDVENF